MKKTLAERYTDTEIELTNLEDEIYDVLKSANIPIEFYWRADHYDMSFELINCPQGWELNKEQEAAIRSMGFTQCWVNHRNETRNNSVFDYNFDNKKIDK